MLQLQTYGFGVNLVIGIIIFIETGFVLSKSRIRKIRSMLFIAMAWIFLSLLYVLEAFLFPPFEASPALTIVANFMPYYSCVALLIALNYMKNDTFNSISLLFLVIYGTLYHVSPFLPDSIVMTDSAGYIAYHWAAWYKFFGLGTYVIAFLLVLYWSILSWRHAPFEIRRESNILIVGAMFIVVPGLTLYLLTSWFPVMLLIANMCVCVGYLILQYILYKEPKLLYMLAFSIYRITIRDHNNHALFSYDWAKTALKDRLFSRYLDGLQTMSDMLIKFGGILDIRFPNGIVIVNETKSITAVLIASRASKLLRDSVSAFSDDFETEFAQLLSASDADPKHYSNAGQILQKYFNNFPSFMIRDEKKQRFFVPRFIPPDVDARLKQIFTADNEYEAVREDMTRVPCDAKSLLKLYDEIKEELKDEGEGEGSENTRASKPKQENKLDRQ